MITPLLTTLFTTLAQVSFTVAGLLAVAIAGDNKRRNYWFGHEARSLFVYISFLLLLLPGFLSLCALIPPSDKDIPSWITATFILGVLYLGLAVVFFFRKRRLAEPQEFKRLENRFSKINSELGSLGLALFFISLGGAGGNSASSFLSYSQAETRLGIVLIIAVMSGAVASIALLRANDPSNKEQEATKTLPPQQERVVENQNSNSGFYVLVTLLIAAITFLIGYLTKNTED